MIKTQLAFMKKAGSMSVGKKEIQVIVKCQLTLAVVSQHLNSYSGELHNPSS